MNTSITFIYVRSISFLDRDLKERGQTIYALSKAVQRLTWHPESTSSDLNISPMQGYLAVAINGTSITVFDISSSADVSDEGSFYKTVATLNGHSDKVVCLAWSPHISGYLVSGSYDHTAQVREFPCMLETQFSEFFQCSSNFK